MAIISNLSPDERAREKAEEAAFNALPLLEQNAIKIAKLEQEWSVFGSMLEITFTIYFGKKNEANLLATEAKEKGFRVDIDHTLHTHLPYVLYAARPMQPTAENITRWEEWFLSQAKCIPDPLLCEEQLEPVTRLFSGWDYPKRLSPSFFLKFDREPNREPSRKLNRNINIAPKRDVSAQRRENYIAQAAIGRAQAAIDRANVLFGHNPCVFEASNGWASKGRTLKGGILKGSVSFSSSAFELVPSHFLENARRHKPSNPEPTASAFSQWLYSLYANAFGDEQDRAEGKTAEELILAERRRAYVTTDESTIHTHFPDWELKHNGMSPGNSVRTNFYSINNLLVRGEPLRVNPDLIYENRRTREILIVEIKRSQMDIPTNLWPNIWGQLWCYSQIQELLDAPRVTVVGEVWGDALRGHPKTRHVYLRANVRRNPRAVAYDRFFRSLFDIYRGVEQS